MVAVVPLPAPTAPFQAARARVLARAAGFVRRPIGSIGGKLRFGGRRVAVSSGGPRDDDGHAHGPRPRGDTEECVYTPTATAPSQNGHSPREPFIGRFPSDELTAAFSAPPNPGVWACITLSAKHEFVKSVHKTSYIAPRFFRGPEMAAKRNNVKSRVKSATTDAHERVKDFLDGTEIERLLAAARTGRHGIAIICCC